MRLRTKESFYKVADDLTKRAKFLLDNRHYGQYPAEHHVLQLRDMIYDELELMCTYGQTSFRNSWPTKTQLLEWSSEEKEIPTPFKVYDWIKARLGI
jgi:hypothetical protein